ncbi:MAG TPA: chorismate mutase [Gaiellaceae bacterium]|nr:chorismate mutase [Gaiellaceae bacterium]
MSAAPGYPEPVRSGIDQDPVVRGLRARITEADRAILAAANERLELVRELKAHKRANGWDFVDPEREAELLDSLAAENPGPLSDPGVRRLFGDVLDLTKRELADDA